MAIRAVERAISFGVHETGTRVVLPTCSVTSNTFATELVLRSKISMIASSLHMNQRRCYTRTICCDLIVIDKISKMTTCLRC